MQLWKCSSFVKSLAWSNNMKSIEGSSHEIIAQPDHLMFGKVNGKLSVILSETVRSWSCENDISLSLRMNDDDQMMIVAPTEGDLTLFKLAF